MRAGGYHLNTAASADRFQASASLAIAARIIPGLLAVTFLVVLMIAGFLVIGLGAKALAAAFNLILELPR